MTKPDIEHLLDHWLGDGIDVLPDRSVDAVLRTLEHTSQRSAWRVPWRTPTMNGNSRLGLLAGAAVIVVFVVGGFFYLGGPGGPSVGGGGVQAPSPTPTASATPAPSVSPTAAATWTTYHSDRYGFDIGQPPGWSTRPSQRDWTFEADATDWLSTAHEALIAPNDAIRVSAWSIPLAPGTTMESASDLEAWAKSYCEKTNDAPCTAIHDRAVPLCNERHDCHPGLLVPFGDDVQAFYTGGDFADKMVVVAVWWAESSTATAPYGGSQQLLEDVLSTMSVWPETVPVEQRLPVGEPTPLPS
jgi:hypothetical protein